MAEARGDPSKRYYVVRAGRDGEGKHSYALVEGIPDAEKPGDASHDSRTGPIVMDGRMPAIWAEINKAGFHWLERSFKRFWVYDPAMAARVRAGETGPRKA